MEQFIQITVLALAVGALYAAVAAGLTLEFGVSRIINFAHGEFVMLGAYITYFIARGHGSGRFIAGLLVASVAMAALSSIAFRVILARVLGGAHHSQLLATLGLSITLQGVATLLWSPNVRTLADTRILPDWHTGGIVWPGNSVFLFAASLLMYGALVVFMKSTRAGLHMRFAADNPELANLSGVEVARMSELAFVIGGAMAGAAGGLVALTLYVSPLVGFELAVFAFAIVALGGLGRIGGALFGAMTLALAIGYVSNYVPSGASLGNGVAFFLLVVALIVRPDGLFVRAQNAGAGT